MTELPKLALSIRQPWAWAIVTPEVGKDIENRDWPTKFRGSVCVHASGGMTRGEYLDFIDTARSALRVRPAPGNRAIEVPGFLHMPRGGIVGVVDIIDCVAESDSPWFFGKWGFVLANPRPVPFYPLKARLGFFDWREWEAKQRAAA